MKTKSFLFSALLTLFVVTGLCAQDKYDYAIVSYAPSNRQIEITIGANDYKRIEVSAEKVKGAGDATAGLEEVDKLVGQGWEVFDTSAGNDAGATRKVFTFFLRKKK
jgi:hypothetical protein